MKVSWDDEIPNIWKVIKFMSQTTNQLIYIYIYISHSIVFLHSHYGWLIPKIVVGYIDIASHYIYGIYMYVYIYICIYIYIIQSLQHPDVSTALSPGRTSSRRD